MKISLAHLFRILTVAIVLAFAGSLTASAQTTPPAANEKELLEYLIPLYHREAKSYVTVGVGCTGGRHRSVAVANALTQHLNRLGYHARVLHRDVKK